MNDEQKKAYTEVLCILKYMDPEKVERIPKKLMSFFKNNVCENYNFELKEGVSLKNQKLSSRTITLLAMLNFNYWCDTEEEKEKLMKIYYENEKKYQQLIEQKYSVENMFDKNKSDVTSQEKGEIVTYKDNIFTRIINRIKQFIFKIKS